MSVPNCLSYQTHIRTSLLFKVTKILEHNIYVTKINLTRLFDYSRTFFKILFQHYQYL